MVNLDRALASALPAFLRDQRWFGAKGRTITSAAVDDLVDLAGDELTGLAIVAIAYEDAPPDRYALLLAIRRDPGALPVVARLDDGESVVDATSDPASMARLLAGFAADGPRPSRAGGRLERLDVSARARRVLSGAMPPIASLGAEQSNTSLRIGEDFMFKLIRRLQPGENPEVEVGRFLLTRTAFRACPPLEGSLTYLDPSGAPFTVGVLQGWIASRGDGWTWALDLLAAAQGGADVAASVHRDMAALGRVTAEFHRALESDEDSPAFSPEQVTPADFAAWRDRLRDAAARAIDLMESLRGSWTDETRTLAAQAIAVLQQDIPDLMRAPDVASFHKIRIHGDYHLGQTLKTADGFALIDFEGEPLKPLEERRRKACVLKDIAGLLRSFEYGIETVAAGDAAAAATLRRRADLRAAFLGSYLDAAASLRSGALPDRAGTSGWLRLFELEKAIYELEYEVNNRPDWIGIPLRGILGAVRRPA